MDVLDGELALLKVKVEKESKYVNTEYVFTYEYAYT